MNKKCSETKFVLGDFYSILRDHSILLNRFEQEIMRTEDTPKFISRDQTEPAVDRMLERLIHGSMGICTEAGELQDAIKKHVMYGRPLDTTNVMEECFDVLWYVILCLSACGFTLEQAMARGVAKLRSRYPDGFTQDLANNRNLQGERSALEDLPEHESKA